MVAGAKFVFFYCVFGPWVQGLRLKAETRLSPPTVGTRATAELVHRTNRPRTDSQTEFERNINQTIDSVHESITECSGQPRAGNCIMAAMSKSLRRAYPHDERLHRLTARMRSDCGDHGVVQDEVAQPKHQLCAINRMLSGVAGTRGTRFQAAHEFSSSLPPLTLGPQGSSPWTEVLWEVYNRSHDLDPTKLCVPGIECQLKQTDDIVFCTDVATLCGPYFSPSYTLCWFGCAWENYTNPYNCSERYNTPDTSRVRSLWKQDGFTELIMKSDCSSRADCPEPIHGGSECGTCGGELEEFTLENYGDRVKGTEGLRQFKCMAQCMNSSACQGFEYRISPADLKPIKMYSRDRRCTLLGKTPTYARATEAFFCKVYNASSGLFDQIHPTYGDYVDLAKFDDTTQSDVTPQSGSGSIPSKCFRDCDETKKKLRFVRNIAVWEGPQRYIR